MGNVAIVYASSAGRTGVIAQEIANSLGAEGCNARLIAVEHIGPKDWAALDAADTIVMGSPTYMGSVSAAFKGFMDDSAGIWEARGWLDKLGAGFTVAGHAAGDKLATLMQLSVFAAQHGMVWVGYDRVADAPGVGANGAGTWLGLSISTPATKGADLEPSELQAAQEFGTRIARATRRWSV